MLVRSLTVLAIVFAPVAVLSADDDNQYKKAKVGDYATHKMTMKSAVKSAKGTMTLTVTAKTDKEVTLKGTGHLEVNGMKKDAPDEELKIDLTKPFDLTKILKFRDDAKMEKVKEGKETIKVGGKEYDCTWTTYKVMEKENDKELEYDLKVWMAKDVFTGIVKMTMTGEFAGQKSDIVMELTETGNKK